MGMNSSNSGSKSRMAMSEINVTPLVDVMLVLLIIFMVTAPLMQQGIDVELPKTTASGMSLSEEPMILVIEANHHLKMGQTSISMEGFSSKLKAIFETRKNKQIYIQADRKVDYGFVAEVMADIRAAGIYSIGLVTLPQGL